MDKNNINTSSWPLGFSATGVNAGLSFKKQKKDLAFFFSHLPAQGAGVFTKNAVKAAPVLLTQQRLLHHRGRLRVIAVNSGSANAGTGPQGLRDAELTSKWVAEALGVPEEEVWLASTGLIGVRVKMAPYKWGVQQIAKKFLKKLTKEGSLAAEAIMTTDTKSKLAEETFDCQGVPVRIWGCAKGSGMIHPLLGGPHASLHATMLSFILTDANVSPSVLQRALETVVDKTFNCVSIDGDTSTNDFVGLMANGASGAAEIVRPQGHAYQSLVAALFRVSDQLTTQIALDGEGASRLIHVVVQGARSAKSARRMAAVIASSPLVKTACHGADPNWGRILMSMGNSGVPFHLDRVKIWLNDILVCRHGHETPFPEIKAIQAMRRKQIEIRVDLGLGRLSAQYKTCDFTGQYVGINAGYRT